MRLKLAPRSLLGRTGTKTMRQEKLVEQRPEEKERKTGKSRLKDGRATKEACDPIR